MNKKKLLSLFLCLAITISCFCFIDKSSTASGATSSSYESSAPTTPKESDFKYIKTPKDNPERSIIQSYNGKETKVIIPETLDGLPVTGIAGVAFANNEKLTYVKIPATVTFISAKAFYKCSSLTGFDIDPANKAFTVVDGVLYRKGTASGEYSDIETLLICPTGKSGKFRIPYGVKTIGSYAFNSCYNLTRVSMYNTVTTINPYAFAYCWNLENIRLSDNLTYLGQEALSYCDSLTRIILPASLTHIGKDAVLGGLDSNTKSQKFYYFVDGIYCYKDSYAHEYLIDQALPKSIIKFKDRSITDLETGIKLIDPYKNLPENEYLDIEVKRISIKNVKDMLPTRYSKAFVYDIEITKNNKTYDPSGKVILNFDNICEGAIPSAAKVYRQIGDNLVLVSGAAHTPFIGAQISSGGRFVVLINDDFSLKGDIDGDGIVTIFDVKAALYASANTLTLTKEQAAAANVDNSSDGKITTKDARKILRLAGKLD